MTLYHSSMEVNNRHALRFLKPSTTPKGLHYYDFETKSWLPVLKKYQLPYDLATYHFLDENVPNKSESEIYNLDDLLDDCVVTCEDSYRLCVNPDFNEWDSKCDERMEQERVWRDEIVNKDAEFEYIDSHNIAHRAKVCWTKSDIVPGVIMCGPRKHPRMNSYGYIYKESKSFAKSGTNIPILTAEELDQEKQSTDLAAEKSSKEQELIKYWHSKMRFCNFRNEKNISSGYLPNNGFWDLTPFYESLTRLEEEITNEKIEQYLKEHWDENEKGEYSPMKQELTGGQLNSAGLLLMGKDHDIVFSSTEFKVKNDIAYLPALGDFYFDIRVKDATYAYLWCGDGSADDVYSSNLGRKFDLVNIEGVYTFPDITYENPLFTTSSCGASMRIHTDGSIVTCKIGMFQLPIHKLWIQMKNHWAVSKIQGRYLLAGYMWIPACSFPAEDLIEIDPEPVMRRHQENSGGQWAKIS